jgi:glycosyltransferase involved in cell wall biosynthesis
VVTTDQDGAGRLSVPLGTPTRSLDGYEVLYFPAGQPARKRPWSAAFARGIDAAAEWADVVHVSSLFLPHNAFVHAACRRHRTPYVVRPHGTLEPYQRLKSARVKLWFDVVYGRRYLRGAAGYHFTAESEAVAATDIVDPVRSFVVPVPVPVPEVPAPVADNQTVLFLGRVAAKKRLDLVLAAWPLVRRHHPSARIVVAGPADPDQEPLLRRAHVQSGVDVLGMVTGEAKDALLRQAAVLVLPSDNENFGVAVAEAMAYGVPVVVTPAVALAARVASAQAGLVVPTGDYLGVADAVCRLLKEPQARAKMGAAGHEAVAGTLSREVVGIDLYRALASLL